jgi:hypothetical protein
MEIETTRMIEIGGVKMEIDPRHAKKVESYKVGDKVRVLIKSYGETYQSHSGMIVGFDNFKERPTIIVAYIDESAYQSSPLKIVFINKDSTDLEIAPMVDDFIAIEKSNVLEEFDKCIRQEEEKIRDLQTKRAYFLKYFNCYFNEAPTTKEAI